jgi:hypothetical protein
MSGRRTSPLNVQNPESYGRKAREIFLVGAAKFAVMSNAEFARPQRFAFVTVRLRGIDW